MKDYFLCILGDHDCHCTNDHVNSTFSVADNATYDLKFHILVGCDIASSGQEQRYVSVRLVLYAFYNIQHEKITISQITIVSCCAQGSTPIT